MKKILQTKYLGQQETLNGFFHQYNIIDPTHPQCHSTVSWETVKALGLTHLHPSVAMHQKGKR